MVAPAFGSGAGDFVSAINLLTRAAKALRETSGASAFRLWSTQVATERSPTRSSFRGHLCHLPLANFIRKIEKFETELSSSRSSSVRTSPLKKAAGGAGRKIQWAECMERELAALKARIGPQIATIILLLQLELLERLDHAKIETAQSRALSDKALASVNDLRFMLGGHIMARGQRLDLPSLLNHISVRQVRYSQELLKLARGTKICTRGLEKRIQVIEQILQSQLDRIEVSARGDDSTSLPAADNGSASGHIESESNPSAKVRTEADIAKYLIFGVFLPGTYLLLLHLVFNYFPSNSETEPMSSASIADLPKASTRTWDHLRDIGIYILGQLPDLAFNQVLGLYFGSMDAESGRCRLYDGFSGLSEVSLEGNIPVRVMRHRQGISLQEYWRKSTGC